MASFLDRMSNWATLKFKDVELEKAFRTEYFEKSLGRVRLSVILAAILYGVFGILDEAIIPDVRYQAWIIRYVIFCPLAILIVILSYFKRFQKLMEPSVIVVAFIAGAGIIVMIALAAPPGSDLYYAGLLLTIWFYYLLLRLRFIPATALAWSVFALYEITAVFIRGASTPILINNTFFFLAFNITGMWACYTMERYVRMDFLQRRTIVEQSEKLKMIFDYSPVGIMHFDPNGAITDCNSEFVSLIGSTRENLVGLNMITKLKDDQVISAVKDVLNGHTGRYEGEYVSLTGGKATWAKADFSPIISPDGQVTGGIAIVTDISEAKKAADAIRESEQRFKKLYSLVRLMCDNAPDLIWAKDLEGKFLFVNRSFCEKLINAKDTDEPIGKNDMFFARRERGSNPETPDWYSFGEVCVGSDAVVINSRKPGRFDEFGNVKGQFLFLDVQKAPFWNEQGELIGTVGCGRDVTKERKIEQSLRESEQRYRDLFENASDMIYTHDLAGNYTSVNELVYSLLGYRPEEFLKLNFHDIADSQFLPVVEKNFLEKILEEVEATGPYEILARKKDGTPVWLEVKSRLMRRDGNVIGIQGIARNVTERKELEAAVHEAQTKYQSIVEAFDGIIYICSQDFEIQFANQRLVKRTEYDPMGRKCHEVVHGLHDICPWCIFKNEQPLVTLRRLRHSPKDNRWYFVVSSPIVHKDGTISRLFLMQDVTEQRAAEEEKTKLREQLFQAQKMEAIGTLAAGIAHDFNNLLQVILGYSELLPAFPDITPKALDGLEKINQAARSGADLVKRLLMFGRKTEINLRPLDLNQLIGKANKMWERTIPKMIDIQLSLADNLQAVNADATQIEQVLMNLVINARDAMPDGGKLVIETENIYIEPGYLNGGPDFETGWQVLLRVSDNGIGMDAETVGRIFEPFFTTKEMAKSTGLGLAVVYGIVQQHGGYITCKSEPSRGTTFEIHFPALRAEEQIVVEDIQESPATGGSETVLIVDDEEQVRFLASEILSEAGYEVIQAANGEEALLLYEKYTQEIGLILLDLIMPIMGGEQCLRELIKVNPSVRVVISSGQPTNGPIEEYLELGATSFISKPYDARGLLNVVRSSLDAGSQ
jgi:PAS domain S-box-containing protein